MCIGSPIHHNPISIFPITPCSSEQPGNDSSLNIETGGACGGFDTAERILLNGYASFVKISTLKELNRNL